MESREKNIPSPLSAAAGLLLARLLLLSFLVTAFCPAHLLRWHVKGQACEGCVSLPGTLSDENAEPIDENTGEGDPNDIFKITKETDVLKPDYSCYFASLLIDELLFAEHRVCLPDWNIRIFSPPPESV